MVRSAVANQSQETSLEAILASTNAAFIEGETGGGRPNLMETKLLASISTRFGASNNGKQSVEKNRDDLLKQLNHWKDLGRLDLVLVIYNVLTDIALETGNFEEAMEHLDQISKFEAEMGTNVAQTLRTDEMKARTRKCIKWKQLSLRTQVADAEEDYEGALKTLGEMEAMLNDMGFGEVARGNIQRDLA